MQDRKSSKFRFSTCSVWSPVSKQKSCRAPAVAEVCGPPEFNETMRLHLTSLGFTRVICFWLRLAQAVCGSAVNSFSAFSANGSTWKLGCPKLAKPAGLWKIVYQQMHRSGFGSQQRSLCGEPADSDKGAVGSIRELRRRRGRMRINAKYVRDF